MYLMPVKKITKVLFARNRSNSLGRERTPMNLSECIESTPKFHHKSRMRWMVMILTLAAILYIMFYQTPAKMVFQSSQNVSVWNQHANNHFLEGNKKNYFKKSIKNETLIAPEVTKIVPTVTPEHVWKTKEITTKQEMRKNLPSCITNVTNRGDVVIKKIKHTSMLQTEYPIVKFGGYYHPEDCMARHKVAILIPYRDREANLAMFLYNIHPFLMRQNLQYRIFIIEQAGNASFNRGRLFNVGFKEVSKYNDWHCMVFHDVDLLPLDSRILYTCPTFPRHMCATVAEKERLSYDAYHTLFGGVAAMTVEHFKKINGYSNMYWGWGAEDNDLFWRIRASRLPTVRYNKSIARYTSLPHPAQHHNPYRYRLLHDSIERIQTDGLSNLVYTIISTTLHHLYTHILVDINPLKENITAVYYRLWHNMP